MNNKPALQTAQIGQQMNMFDMPAVQPVAPGLTKTPTLSQIEIYILILGLHEKHDEHNRFISTYGSNRIVSSQEAKDADEYDPHQAVDIYTPERTKVQEYHDFLKRKDFLVYRYRETDDWDFFNRMKKKNYSQLYYEYKIRGESIRKMSIKLRYVNKDLCSPRAGKKKKDELFEIKQSLLFNIRTKEIENYQLDAFMDIIKRAYNISPVSDRTLLESVLFIFDTIFREYRQTTMQTAVKNTLLQNHR